MTIKSLAADDTPKLSVDINTDNYIVKVEFTCKPEEKSPHKYNLRWTMDFSTCVEKTMLKLAARSFLIDLQRMWRKDPKRTADEWQDATFNVADVMAAAKTRQKKSDFEKASGDAAKLGDEEKMRLIAELEASMSSES
jgi:hypothetical protein